MDAIRWILLAALLSSMQPAALAEIYRYKDTNGKWQFTDRKPQQDHDTLNLGGQQAEEIEQDEILAGEPRDLAQRLEQKYHPTTEVSRVTLAVVKVENSGGTGSGFFISHSGHLITNKHVIRPADFDKWKKQQATFDENEEKFQRAEQQLKTRYTKLKKYKAEIDQYRRDIEDYSEARRRIAEAEYQSYYDRYQSSMRDYRSAKSKLQQQRASFDESQRQFDRRSGQAKLAQEFGIVLKDNTRLKARLISLSKEHDLALLKVDGYRTPKLELGEPRSLSQGMPIFTVGSPLGFKDHVTSGVVTSFEKDSIIFDAKIMPGNSGGPLISKQGQVMGVNTLLRYSQHSLAAGGFGVAISVDALRDTFSAQLAGKL